jgi:hypothetical protein
MKVFFTDDPADFLLSLIAMVTDVAHEEASKRLEVVH